MELAYLGGDRRTLRQGSGLRTAGGRADAYLPHDGPESGCERSDGFRRQVPFVSLPVGAQGPLLERYDRVRPRGQYAGHALVAQLRGYTIDPVWNAQIGRKSGDYLYNGTVEFTLSHPATYISYADEKDISNPNQTWLRSDVPGHQNDRLWGTYFEKEAVGAATVLLSKSAFDPCPAGYRIP